MKRLNLVRNISFIVAILYTATGFAQYHIKLKEVVKFELIRRGGGISNYYSDLEIVWKQNTWKCYQPKILGFDKHSASMLYGVPAFIKDIPAETLENLLSKLANRDSAINIKRFNISTTELVNDCDSLPGLKLDATQRASLIKAVQSEKIITQTVYEMLHPMPADDKDYFAIKITTNARTTYIAEAYSFGYPYDLPWYVGLIKNFDPAISVIFNELTGHPTYAGMQRKLFHLNIDRSVYRKYLMNRTNAK